MTTTAATLKIPTHIAIIMDGNGRWAKEQGMQRILGHESGAETVREITRECSRLGVGRLTLYAFSAENWKRPLREIDFLMKLLEQYLVQERKEIMENNIRFTSIGRLDELPEGVRKVLQETTELSSKNTGMVLCLASSAASFTTGGVFVVDGGQTAPTGHEPGRERARRRILRRARSRHPCC